MKRILFAAAVLSASLLAGCETATPYQPLGAGGIQAAGGYFDHQIEANRWQVGFKGNELTGRQTVERYLLYRAAELTTSQGYDWFEAVERHTDKKTDGYAVPDPYYAGFGGYWGPRWGLYRRGGWNYGYGDAFWGGGPFDYDHVNQFQATAEILLGHGQKPANRQAFDARSVLEHLGGAVHPPK
jgi:predicted small secreted protein